MKTKYAIETQARADFSREVESRRGWYGLKTNETLGAACGITKSTMRSRLLKPDTFTVEELRHMIQILNLDVEIALRFLGYDSKTINRVRKLHQQAEAEAREAV